MMRQGLLFLMLALAACGEKQAPLDTALLTPFTGLWANSFTDCDLSPGTTDAAPIKITETTFVGFKNDCQWTKVTPTEDSTEIFAARRCASEGNAVDEIVLLRRKGNTLMMSHEDGASVTWTVCPEGAARQ